MVGKSLSWNNDVALSIHSEGTRRKLRPAVNEELFCIGREALTNAFRHAQAHLIEILLDYGTSEVRLICRDDGCGMDSRLLEEGRTGHWGLSGMRERADRIGAKFSAKSTPGNGTEIAVVVPGRRAYVSVPTWKWLQVLAQIIGRMRSNK